MSRRFLKQLILLLILLPGVLFLSIEIIGRQIGLTDPPLSVFDDKMEYRYAPNQDCLVMGRRFVVNEYSQRSESLRDRKPGDLRVMVIGDSIPSGGTQVDQEDLATTLLERHLQQKTGRPTQVLNASAGSWGPANELAYLRKFGTFDADVFVVIFSTQDSNDQMTFEPTVDINSSYPGKKPVCVTSMLFSRYIPRFFAIMNAQSPTSQPATEIEPKVMSTITELVQYLKSTGKPVIVILHPQRDELKLTSDLPAWTAIKDAALNGGATIVDARTKYREAIHNGINFYRDTIHPNPAGQHVLADVIEEPVINAIGK